MYSTSTTTLTLSSYLALSVYSVLAVQSIYTLYCIVSPRLTPLAKPVKYGVRWTVHGKCGPLANRARAIKYAWSITPYRMHSLGLICSGKGTLCRRKKQKTGLETTTHTESQPSILCRLPVQYFVQLYGGLNWILVRPFPDAGGACRAEV